MCALHTAGRGAPAWIDFEVSVTQRYVSFHRSVAQPIPSHPRPMRVSCPSCGSRLKVRPSRQHASSASTPQLASRRPARPARRAARLSPSLCVAAAASPELHLAKQLAASACVAAGVLALGSLFTDAGRQRWAALVSSWQALLPANPAFRRALAWLPVIAVAKGMESVLGLPILNWVYIAIAAQTYAAYVTAAKEQRAAAPSDGAPSGEASTLGTAVSASGGLNGLARNLFANRFPELAQQEVLAVAPAMMGDTASGGQAQGQLYVTTSTVAFHGAFGRTRRIIALADVSDARLERPDGSQARGRSLTVLQLATAEGPVTLTAVDMLGGTDALTRIAQLCDARRDGA